MPFAINEFSKWVNGQGLVFYVLWGQFCFDFIYHFFSLFICQNCIWGWSCLLNFVIALDTSLSPWWHLANFLAFSQYRVLHALSEKDPYNGQLVLVPMPMSLLWQLFESYWCVMTNHSPQIHKGASVTNLVWDLSIQSLPTILCNSILIRCGLMTSSIVTNSIDCRAFNINS